MKDAGRYGQAAVALALCCWIGTTAAWAASEDPDWPCIQRKVPQISAGMVWAGPPIDQADDTWRKDETIHDLVAKVAARTTDIEDAKSAIGAYAAGLGADKNSKLTALFAGALATINAERDSIIAGIARYARRQKALARKIEDATAEFNRLPADGGEADRNRREELAEEIRWDTRIFQEREQSLKYVCEQPVLLEQRAFALGREVMGHLD